MRYLALIVVLVATSACSKHESVPKKLDESPKTSSKGFANIRKIIGVQSSPISLIAIRKRFMKALEECTSVEACYQLDPIATRTVIVSRRS